MLIHTRGVGAVPPRKRYNPAGLVLAAVILSLCSFARAEGEPKDTLLVLSQRGEDLAIVDPTTFQVLAHIPVGHSPHEVAVSTDGKTAFVTNYGAGVYHTIAQVDLVHRKLIRSIDISPFRGPHGIVFVADHVWFTAEVNKAIARLNPATGTVDWVLGTGQDRTHLIYVFPDEHRIVATNISAGTVSIIDKGAPPLVAPPVMPPIRAGEIPRLPVLKEEWLSRVVKVGNGSEGFDVSPDGRQIWVANAGDGTISVIDTVGGEVVRTLASQLVGANRLKFTPDGRFVLVSQLFAPDLIIFDATTGSPVKHVAVGQGAAGILVQPDGARAYVSCLRDNYVAVVDLKSMTMVAKIAGGMDMPDGLAWASR